MPLPASRSWWVPVCSRARYHSWRRAAATLDPPKCRPVARLCRTATASHGLDPADYDRDALQSAIQYGHAQRSNGKRRKALASLRATWRTGTSGLWRASASRSRPNRSSRRRSRCSSTARLPHGTSAASLNRWHPTEPQYASLRGALAKLPASAVEERQKLEVSLERWRWLPHDLGTRHLLVNLPEYKVHLIDDGRELAAHRVIIGKVSTPTPQFSATVSGVILNPTWQVPPSIIAESVGKLVRSTPRAARARGFSWSSRGGRLTVTQGPGAGNALGLMKLDMPNAYTVYLHDTPNKALFDKPDRTFSHGCIRTDRALDLRLSCWAGRATRSMGGCTRQDATCGSGQADTGLRAVLHRLCGRRGNRAILQGPLFAR